MVRRSQFTIVATILFGAALLLWTVLAPVDVDHLWPFRPPPLRSTEWVATYAAGLFTTPIVSHAAVLLAAVWAARRGFHAVAGSAVLTVALTASSTLLIDHYAAQPFPHLALGPAYPAPRVAAAAAAAILLVTLTSTTRRSWRVITAWVVGSTAFLALAALGNLWLGESRLTGVVAGLLLGGLTASLANLLSDVHLIRTPASRRTRHRAAVIYNPAKVRDIAVLRGMINGEFAERRWAPPLWLATQIEDPGAGMAAEALDEGADLILVAGGDGTVRTVLGALVGRDVAVALIPSGTGNLLARNLGIPLDASRALDLAVDGDATPIDLLRITDLETGKHQTAAVMAGLGADAAVLADADERLKKQLGPAAYLLAGLPHIRATPVPTRVTVDGGETLRRDASLIEVGNVGDLQAGVSLMPTANAHDGVLDVLVASPKNTGDVAQMMAGVLLQSGYEPLIDRMTGASVTVEVDRPMPFQIDGDVLGTVTRIRFDVVAGAVRIVCP